MRQLLLVMAGSGLGGGARYLAGGWVLRALGPSFPYGTLAVNLLGAFAISVLMEASFRSAWMGPPLKLALMTGFLGGFTTYSTFNYETLALLQRGAVWAGLLNVLATVVVCLAAGLLGLWTGRWLFGP